MLMGPEVEEVRMAEVGNNLSESVEGVLVEGLDDGAESKCQCTIDI